MDKTLIVGDIHGDYRNMLNLLQKVGATTGDKYATERAEGWRLIQIGDLVHCGKPRGKDFPGVDDVLCLEYGLELFDDLLIGNHELPFLYPRSQFEAFHGSLRYGEILNKLYENRQRFTPATAAHGYLVTHAGWAYNSDKERPAEEHAEVLCDRFYERVDTTRPVPVFDAIGHMRGGFGDHGGIFWCDWSELKSNIPQIVGHSPGKEVRQKGQHWCVDVGAALSKRVCGLLHDGEKWEPVYFP